MSSSLSFQPCAICHSRPADKTNSHIIPSFFIAMVSSVNNSYKRDKELLYTIGNHLTTAYIGRSVKEEDLLDSFDALTEGRLKELSRNITSKDYILCSHCERKLGEYFESPWHNHLFLGKHITPDLAYFFWVSLLWRVSFFDGNAFKLPTHLEKSLEKRLNLYIQAKDNKQNTLPILNKAPFTYKVIYCKDYSKKYSGFIYSEYDPKSKIASFMLGDVAVCFSFQKHGTFDRHSFYGLESTFMEADINDGFANEKILNVGAVDFEAFGSNIIDKFKKLRLDMDKENIIGMWNLAIKELGIPLPSKPSKYFIQYVISKLYSNTVKTGEKITKDHFAKCFVQGLVDVYGIPDIQE